MDRNDLERDAFDGLRALSPRLRRELPDLLVDRRGDDAQAYMRTENIAGQVLPGEAYAVGPRGLRPVAVEAIEAPLPKPAAPPHARVRGEWRRGAGRDPGDANILGDLDDFNLPVGTDRVSIPLVPVRADWVAFYESRLVAHGETIRFEADAEMPVTVTAVGPRYVEGYLMHPDLGGGTYLEVHDRPHFHMPVGAASAGGLILGKPAGGNEYLLTAFRIPPGHGVVTGPGVIHNDAHLIGCFFVIYSLTPEYSTAILRRSDGSLGAFDLVEPATATSPD